MKEHRCLLAFLRAVSHSLGARVPCDVMNQSDSNDNDDADDVPTASGNGNGAPSAAVQPPDLCEVCMVVERDAHHACTGPLRPSTFLCVVCGTDGSGSWWLSSLSHSYHHGAAFVLDSVVTYSSSYFGEHTTCNISAGFFSSIVDVSVNFYATLHFLTHSLTV